MTVKKNNPCFWHAKCFLQQFHQNYTCFIFIYTYYGFYLELKIKFYCFFLSERSFNFPWIVLYAKGNNLCRKYARNLALIRTWNYLGLKLSKLLERVMLARLQVTNVCTRINTEFINGPPSALNTYHNPS